MAFLWKAHDTAVKKHMTLLWKAHGIVVKNICSSAEYVAKYAVKYSSRKKCFRPVLNDFPNLKELKSGPLETYFMAICETLIYPHFSLTKDKIIIHAFQVHIISERHLLVDIFQIADAHNNNSTVIMVDTHKTWDHFWSVFSYSLYIERMKYLLRRRHLV